ncbi:MAG TPA: urease accessory protein UreF [Candidatus Acidoferrum sp.]
MSSLTDRMRLLQFGDSVLPVGSFSFSNGVEAAIQQSVVHDVATLQEFVGVAVHQAATSDGIALLEAHRALRVGDMSRIVGADKAVFIRKLNEEMRTMTTRMGRKLGEMAVHILHPPLIEAWLGHVQQHHSPGTYPVALGLLFAVLNQPEEHAFAAHQYGVATMMLSAALRLMKLNYLDSQAILFAINEMAEEAYQRASLASLEDMAAFAPCMDILAGIHVRSHVRMFMN